MSKNGISMYDDFEKVKANHVPLSPLSFLPRAASFYPDKEAVVYGNRHYTWAQTYERCKRLASAINKLGVSKGDTVSVIATNTPEMVEAHFGIAMAGAVLNSINVRLDSDTIAYILNHSEAKILISDTGFSTSVKEALKQVENKNLIIIDIEDSQSGIKSETIGSMDYEKLLETGDPNYDWSLPDDEWDALSLNYTSGTSGKPKGVVYHHRGSYLMTMGTISDWRLPMHPSYLYTVPLFHCNGWGHAWTMTALAGKIVCCRQVSAMAIYDAINTQKVTHLGGAPIILGMIINAESSDRKEFSHTVEIMTAGAPPPAAILEGIEKLGFNVTHVYGLTETYGHVTQCAWNDSWNEFDEEKQNEIKARQGVRYPNTEGITVMDPETMKEVPKDGKTIGEIMIKGNVVMKGYFKDKGATDKAMKGGWFHSGDLAVMHPDGYVKIQDRSKDIIISGGENISSIEIENTLAKHPSVSIAAVVAKPDEKWGEVPCAFIEMVQDKPVTEKELISFCKETLAGFKVPKQVVFCELPKTSTGKIQKFELRKKF